MFNRIFDWLVRWVPFWHKVTLWLARKRHAEQLALLLRQILKAMDDGRIDDQEYKDLRISAYKILIDFGFDSKYWDKQAGLDHKDHTTKK